MEDLIDGLDETFISTYVEDKQGYFNWTAKSRKVKVQKLVSLNHVLRGLADVLETSLASDGYGTINIGFDACTLDGNWHPARWNKQTLTKGGNTYKTRYVKHPEEDEGSYEVYADDYNTLKIDPDWADSNISNVVYVSWGLFKSIDNEPQSKSARTYRVTRFKTIFEFLEAIAFTFGCYIMYYWETTTDFRIKFISRSSMNSEQVYLKSASPNPKKKMSTLPLDEINNDKIRANAFYLSGEGQDAYTKTPQSVAAAADPMTGQLSEGYTASEGNV